MQNTHTSECGAGASLSRRALVACASAGIAASWPAFALASGQPGSFPVQPEASASEDLLRHIAEFERVKRQRKELDAKFNLIAKSEPVGVSREEYEAWQQSSGLAALDEQDEELYEDQLRAEEQICNLPCASVADVLEKLRFYFHHFDNEDYDYSERVAALLQSMKAFAFALSAEAAGRLPT